MVQNQYLQIVMASGFLFQICEAFTTSVAQSWHSVQATKFTTISYFTVLPTFVLWPSISPEVQVSSRPLLHAHHSPYPSPLCIAAHLMYTDRWFPCYCPLGKDTCKFHCQHLHGWMSAPGYCWTHGAPVSSSLMLCHCKISSVGWLL